MACPIAGLALQTSCADVMEAWVEGDWYFISIMI
jgi:hypothetical protein